MADPETSQPPTAKRASIFDTGDEDVDLSAFAPKTTPNRDAPSADQVRVVSEAAKFPSRERPKAAKAPAPVPAAAPIRAAREQRRHRTGRNIQLNVKASQATIDAFYEITDQQGWVLGETLEHALEALRRSLKNGGKNN